MSEKNFPAFYESMERCPIIAGVNNDELLAESLKSDCEIVYMLYGDICNLPELVDAVVSAGKIPIVHIDLINGLASREISVDFIQKYTKAAGIISTKLHLIKRGNELGLITIQRFFMLDRLTYNNIKKHVRGTSPDIVEVMPAGLFKMIRYVLEEIGDTPLVASGLVLDKSDVMGALSAGALAVSTTNTDVWNALD